MPSIILATLNAKYIHASLGLRYLLANMGDLKALTVLREFTIARKPQDVVDELLATLGAPQTGQQAESKAGSASDTPQVIGFGVYIWNVTQTCEVVRLLKQQRPNIKIVLGGPEVSHEVDQQDIVHLADHVITGWGDVSFPKLCRALLYGPQPLMKIIAGEQPPLDQITLPYAEYSDADLAHRLLYVEASRGCPFKCEFCLSSLDKTAWAFELDAFLAELDTLYQRGARNFKFVDRTFNLKIDASVRILQFFLGRLPSMRSGKWDKHSQPVRPELVEGLRQAQPERTGDLFVHFEVIPDHLPDRLKDMIAKFPPGVLQFEVGIQSFNVDVQQRISRRQDNAKTEANLRWLVEASSAHLHTDLIFGLPGETLASFAAGFDRLYALRPHEIQLGILKRLRGTPIARHSAAWGMVYEDAPPYTVLQTSDVSRADMQRFTRLARYWDLVANSGRFPQTAVLLLETCAAGSTDQNPSPLLGSPSSGSLFIASPFTAFMAFSDWLWQTTGKTSGLTPEVLVDSLFDYLTTCAGAVPDKARSALLADYRRSGARANPTALAGELHPHPLRQSSQPASTRSLVTRQSRHGVGAT